MELTRNRKYFVLISIFMTAYPFLVLPYWNLYYVTLIKLVYLCLFTIIIWFFLIYQCIKKKQLPGMVRTHGERLAVLFLLIISLSTFFSQDPSVSFWGAELKFQGLIAWFSYISLFFFTYNLIPVLKQVKIIRLVVFASFFVGLYGIFQHFYLGTLADKEVERGFVRSWAVFDNPNYFGTYLVLMMVLAMTLFLLAKGRARSFVYLAILSTLFLCLLYTATRGAWIGAFSGMLVLTILLIWKRKGLWKRWIILLCSFSFILILANFSEDNFFFNRILSISNDVDALVQENNGDAGAGRWRIWKTSAPLIMDNYVFGSGPSTFLMVYPPNSEAGDNGSTMDNSHNEYLETAITMGIPAVFVYVTLVFAILKNSFSAVKRLEGNQQIVGYGLIATIIGYMVQTFFNISVVTVAPFFWMLLGMSYAFSKHTAVKEE